MKGNIIHGLEEHDKMIQEVNSIVTDLELKGFKVIINDNKDTMSLITLKKEKVYVSLTLLKP
jgi:hypothetical protein